MILHSEGLLSTVDKELLWTSIKDGERGLDCLYDLQLAGYFNYQTITILNGNHIASNMMKSKINDFRKAFNKELFITNMNILTKVGETINDTLYKLVKVAKKLKINIIDSKKIPYKIDQLPYSPLMDIFQQKHKYNIYI
jgi:hypothetical protein